MYIKAKDDDDEHQTEKMDEGRWHFIVNREVVAGNAEIAALLDAGADPNLTNRRTGRTYPQFICLMENRIGLNEMMQTLDLFMNRPDFNVNHIDEYGLALIHRCVQMERPHLLRQLLLHRRIDLDINAQIGMGSWLDENGLMKKQVTMITGSTALKLLFAQTTPRQEKLQLLLDNGADPNIVAQDGFGPIHNLIRNTRYCRQSEIRNNFSLLLAPPTADNNNTDPNARVQVGSDYEGFTPLHFALARRCPQYVFDALLKGGADLSLRNYAGRTPLEYARSLTDPVVDPAIIKLLWEKSPEFLALRRYAEMALWRPTHGNSEIYGRLLEEGGLHPPRPPRPPSQ